MKCDILRHMKEDAALPKIQDEDITFGNYLDPSQRSLAQIRIQQVDYSRSSVSCCYRRHFFCPTQATTILGSGPSCLDRTGDKAASTDSSFLRELFLQRLRHDVRMVLADSGDEIHEDLDKLATLADKVLEVAIPQVSTVATSTEVEQLSA
uniref:Uncharacterized protein n=1 Tax=Amphimedon queenslandica TaxID=400682 RepID=A0A1X7UB44_AMPQE